MYMQVLHSKHKLYTFSMCCVTSSCFTNSYMFIMLYMYMYLKKGNLHSK